MYKIEDIGWYDQYCIQKGMNAADYATGEAFQAEKRTVFAKEWLPLCAKGQVAGAGDFFSASVGGWGVFAVRDEGGTVRVLRNACRHQNMPVVATGAGSCQSLRCRFHGWTYDLAGKFQSAPPPVAPVSPDQHLQTLASEIRGGLVWFNMGDTAVPADLPEVHSTPYAGTTTTEIACNWKVAVEELLLSLSRFTWHWPLLAVRNGGGTTIVEQVVPHTFLKTRLMTHVFGTAPDGLKPALNAFKQACEQRQTANMPATANKQVAQFHQRLTEAYGSS